MLRSGLVAPSQTTHSTLSALLNEDDAQERDRLTEKWRDHKLQELNFIGVVGALLAGVLTSTGSWPSVLSNGKRQPWSVRAFWFCGILFALFSVLIAAQQTLRLHRLSAHRDGLAYIRRCMAGGVHRDGRVRPRRGQVYAWQASTALLTAAVICMIGGITVLVWMSTEWGPFKDPETESWWDDDARLAVTFSSVLVLTLTVFMVAQASLTVDSTGE
ncbi:hypothetical protein BKA67DRAFT_657324 [Truncatella angustata]|uniref:Uncharacterized protein n=1 Tax=Truncatella angustata TaxID=152316 RepID=A0A9P8UMH0_9PEZI|nr:uncharacterized protein BKA67DRAFT_657324 [Truncatella angustata]KAH6655379.1 hypothetical protein BKA67DRAFT_657324 [Truncatella angustata]KAH8197136.1 hypothetical protein TruAng_008702 [Truncatella angustata]